ncbi:MAG TPA: GTPase HflX [Hyphomicrobiaceae bacterium]|nr:GTPase HflX [Hyphomicrobiaceae bacterium]
MRTLLLVPVPPQGRRLEAPSAGARRPALHAPADRLAEAEGLARAIGLEVRAALIVPLHEPRPATLFGKGKVEEIEAAAAAEGAGLVIVDHALSPIQQRNLEKAWNTKVLDRTGLILEIFGARAATREGRLQVELAHLTYQRSRLVRSWTHLERQRGGFGFLGGPGETQIETDRRLISERIDRIRRELETVVKTRALHRRGRSRVPYPVVAIVGYTNAGKSTLFNRLTGAAVDARDQVFATLDPTMREVRLPGGRRAILSDTVGFISDLPTTLVAAFRATLEEVVAADLILHVRDITHEESAAQCADVEAVLADLGIEEGRRDRLIEVWNKTDRLTHARREEVENAARRRQPSPVLVSARTGEGLDRLLAEIEHRLGERDEVVELTLPPWAGRITHWLHENAEVLDRKLARSGATRLRVRIDRAKRARLNAQLAREGLACG